MMAELRGSLFLLLLLYIFGIVIVLLCPIRKLGSDEGNMAQLRGMLLLLLLLTYDVIVIV